MFIVIVSFSVRLSVELFFSSLVSVRGHAQQQLDSASLRPSAGSVPQLGALMRKLKDAMMPSRVVAPSTIEEP